jgi:hypothetical protein
VVTVSGVNGPDGTGSGACEVATGGAIEVLGAWLLVAAGGLTVLDTEPLSPPPRMTTVQITATSRIAPATPATQIHRRSIGSW